MKVKPARLGSFGVIRLAAIVARSARRLWKLCTGSRAKVLFVVTLASADADHRRRHP